MPPSAVGGGVYVSSGCGFRQYCYCQANPQHISSIPTLPEHHHTSFLQDNQLASQDEVARTPGFVGLPLGGGRVLGDGRRSSLLSLLTAAHTLQVELIFVQIIKNILGSNSSKR